MSSRCPPPCKPICAGSTGSQPRTGAGSGRAAAEKQIAATRESAMGNVRGIAADAAGAIVQRLTGVLPDGTTLNSAVDASLKG